MNLIDDFKNIFLNTADFAEEVVYTPKSGEPRTIKAIIKRNRQEPQSEVKNRYGKTKVEVYVSRDPVAGIASINIGDDILSFPEFSGGTNIEWIIEDIINSNAGMWHLVAGK